MTDNQYSPSWENTGVDPVDQHPKSGVEYVHSRIAAIELGYHPATVRKMIEDGRLAGYREQGQTGRWMATRASVDELAEKRRKRRDYAAVRTPGDVFIGTRRASTLLRREKSTVIRMIQDGDIMGYKEPGPVGRWMISQRSIQAYIERCIAVTALRLARRQEQLNRKQGPK